MGIHLYTNGAWTDSGRIYRNSVNLFDGTYHNSYLNPTGTYITPDNTTKSIIIPCDGNKTYTIKQYNTFDFHKFRIATFTDYPTNNAQGSIIVSDDTLYEYTFTTDINDKYIVFYCAYPYTPNPDLTIMVNAGSTALPYEPYNVVDWYTNNGHSYSSGAWS